MYSRYGKRASDIVTATMLLVVALLPMAIVAIAIRLTSKGPALFRQKRYGQYKKPFTIYKFRSMAIHTPSDRATNDFHDSHAYITTLGKIIRKLSIDELPQLLNVIKGDMSLIGPRPLLEKRVIDMREKYGANDVKPGITGWAQVNGRDELKDADKAKLDGYYAEHIGVMMDVKCLLKTVWVIVCGHGHAEGHEQKAASKNNDTLVAGE